MDTQTKEVATIAGGCFWCLDAVYVQLKGVEKVVSGYIGGKKANPTYKEVCGGNTGHAEAVQITYDPKIISYEDLLNIFFTIHDPTTLNRQGHDVGTQYRSAIFYHNDEQKAIAQKVIASWNAENSWGKPIITELTPYGTYYVGEDYHQGYFDNNPAQPYCQAVIVPKIAKLRKHFFSKLTA